MSKPIAGNTKPRRHVYLKEWLKAKDLTHQEVADALEKSRNTVTRWANATRGMDQKKLAAIASVLGIQPADLYRLPPLKTAPLPPPPPPPQESVDELLRGADEATRDLVLDLARRLRRGAR